MEALTDDQRKRLFEIADEVMDGRALTPAQDVFRRVWELEGYVNGGGLVSYFEGSSGGDAPLAEADFMAIGAPQMATLIKAAVHLAGDAPWADDLARNAYFVDLPEDRLELFEDLDQAFISYPDGDTERMLFGFAQTNNFS